MSTSLPKVIWEEGRVAAKVSPHWLQWRAPNSPPESTPSCAPIPKPHHQPHPETRPTYDAKRHPDPFRRFFTMYWTDRRTERLRDRSRESLMTIGRCAMRATPPRNSTTQGCPWSKFIVSIESLSMVCYLSSFKSNIVSVTIFEIFAVKISDLDLGR